MALKKDKYKGRSLIIVVFIFCLSVILLAKSAQLQLISNDYKTKASATALEKQTTYPSRGLIFDRNLNLLVNNNPIYDVYVTINRISENFDTTGFCNIFDISKQEFIDRTTKDWRSGRFSKNVPFIFYDKLVSDDFIKIQETLFNYPGFQPRLRSMRGYPYANAANVLGYISEVDQIQIDSAGYTLGDYSGTAGLEHQYEDFLKGVNGMKMIVKDNLGREVGPFQEGKMDTSATSGHDIEIGLDIDLQVYAEKLLKNKIGSIVAIEPATGEILTMATSPSYNPNVLSIHNERAQAFERLLQDTLKPFFDRSTMAKYPPGSIFKTIVGLIGLEENVLYPKKYIRCFGEYYYSPSYHPDCRNHPSPTGVPRALQYSCNTYFFTVFRDIVDKYGQNNPEIGLDKFKRYVQEFGLGDLLYIDLPNEMSGNVPNSEYYDQIYNRGGWRSPTIMSIGIGQGEIQLTTVQMANLAAAIANKGYYFTPHFVKKISNPDKVIPDKFRLKKEVSIHPNNFIPIIEGMELAVSAGTATRARVRGLNVCGKTGTVENPHGEDHSVFFGFAPKENPQIAIAVYVENAGGGGRTAAPIASFIMEKYINKEIQKYRLPIEEVYLNLDLISSP
jgi:penicillin-binding protein 2